MIELIDVNFYIDQKRILKDINLKIQKGEFVAIVGPNGSGKSTLLNIISGIYTPTSGKRLIFGKQNLTPQDKQKISFVPQKVTNFNQSFPLSVFETVLLGLVPKKGLLQRFSKQDFEKAESILEKLQIKQLKNRLIGQLSGGQQQRVFLARALISDPQILLLDEPTVGIDSLSEQLLFEILGEKKKEGTTILMVTHDVYAVTQHADTIICMGDGMIYTACSAKEFSPSKFESVYKYKIKKIEHRHSYTKKEQNNRM
ncbi:metal ABC transporter ATP-binding protein [Caldicellulosiruptor sp. DIB 104C]|uniref:metal ABC transporter ATP-binding protein n=2 Tax=unclassified Caldicellulosiruptor TaxID=2622462 RepID=UPI002305C9B9|nr:metal ABC transporter ATP-binding protein [Caldicellulosiruptor sp. DIB 104C]